MSDDHPSILYHYCSNDAFLKILQNKTIRLSSLSLSNDTKEGMWLIDAILEDRSPPISEIDASLLKKYLTSLYKDDSVGFCLSVKEDLLSQWRGYADGGHGVSIGFSYEAIKSVSEANNAEIVEIKYMNKSERKYIDEFQLAFSEIITQEGLLDDDKKVQAFSFITAPPGAHGPINPFAPLKWRLSSLSYEFYKYKNPAFREEMEWRVLFDYYNQGDVKYTASRNLIKPYIDISFTNQFNIISSVTLGPKNATPEAQLRIFLDSNGYRETEIKRSVSTYR